MSENLLKQLAQKIGSADLCMGCHFRQEESGICEELGTEVQLTAIGKGRCDNFVDGYIYDRSGNIVRGVKTPDTFFPHTDTSEDKIDAILNGK